jgi:hypothetical protein
MDVQPPVVPPVKNPVSDALVSPSITPTTEAPPNDTTSTPMTGVQTTIMALASVAANTEAPTTSAGHHAYALFPLWRRAWCWVSVIHRPLY